VADHGASDRAFTEARIRLARDQINQAEDALVHAEPFGTVVHLNSAAGALLEASTHAARLLTEPARKPSDDASH
jgi:hypothetical protein